MIQWDEEYQAIVDEMGLPISHSEAQNWLKALKKYTKKEPDALVGLHNRMLRDKHPRWVGQIDATRESMS